MHNVTFVSDNKSLIMRMKERAKYDEVYTSMHLSPEMDLTKEIRHQQNDNQISAQYLHVKGHQDDTKPN